jgi:hypothetical protein
MSHAALSNLYITYDERHDVLAAHSRTVSPDAMYALNADTTLHYCSKTRQVMGITLRHFLSRFPLMACTISIEEHGAAIAREYFETHPLLSE